jgi:hypothetical protein
MIVGRDTLEQALRQGETGALAPITTIIVSRQWWEGLSPGELEAYRRRADHAAVELRADDAISSYFVELRGGEEGPPLSTEQPM